MKEVKEQVNPIKTVDGTCLPQGERVSLQGRLRLDAVKNIMVHICWYMYLYLNKPTSGLVEDLDAQ